MVRAMFKSQNTALASFTARALNLTDSSHAKTSNCQGTATLESVSGWLKIALSARFEETSCCTAYLEVVCCAE